MSTEKKLAIIEFTEQMTSKPAELYRLIYNFIMENPRDTLDDFFENQPKAKPRIHKGPDDATCIACEG